MVKKTTNIILGIIIFIIALAIAGYFTKAKKVRKQEVAVSLVPVNIIKAAKGNYPITINATGKVEAALSVDLKSEVSGYVNFVNKKFIPGGFFNKKEVILSINNKDYEIALLQQKANVDSLNAQYKQALGKEKQAELELSIYMKTTKTKPENTELILRKPDLEQAKANLEAAKAQYNKAKLDLSRTKIKAKFNSMVTVRSVNYGGYAAVGDSLATLVGTDEYWVETTLTFADSHWLYHKDMKKNKAVVIMNNSRGVRIGEVFKILNYVDSDTKLVKILIKVEDPLLLKHRNKGEYPLLINDFLNVKISGRAIKNSYRLPVNSLKPNNIVWVIANNKLKYKKVEVLYIDDKYAYISNGLDEGDNVITSDIAIPVEGMGLKIATS